MNVKKNKSVKIIVFQSIIFLCNMKKYKTKQKQNKSLNFLCSFQTMHLFDVDNLLKFL